ncbi:MAG TPA: SHOCT domain-containing protein [Terriglobia bacterium]|nr:SHOCT domain-containing protein [Terriglobia bacterium]
MTDNPTTISAASDDQGTRRAVDQLLSLLVPNEKLEAYAVQRRIFALFHRRILVGATTGRFIGMTRGLFGGFDPQDVRWQDLKEVRIRVGIFGADLTITAFTSPDLAMAGQTRVLQFTGLRKAEAETVYRICQAQDQAWREKRRVRELEELRAKSGGVHLESSPASANLATGSGSGMEDPAVRLQRAKEMLDKGLISDSEYESMKARIISSF